MKLEAPKSMASGQMSSTHRKATSAGPSPSQVASSGTMYLIFIQVASRGLTFIGNQVLLRFLSPDLLGLSMQLELFSVFVLYFSRESLRVALQRAPQVWSSTDGEPFEPAKSKAEESQSIVNLSYIAVLMGLPLTLVTAYLYQHNASKVVTESPLFTIALRIYALATIIELLAEPSFVILQQRLLYKSRARSETLAAILKCVSACMSAFWLKLYGQPASVLPAAIGQLCYAVMVFTDYGATAFSLARAEGFYMSMRTISDAPQYLWSRFSRPLASLAATLYGQSIFKQILTQGDAYILSFFASLSDQGAFALASNYGGLIARLFFQPVEEDSRNVFGRLLAGSSKAQPKPAPVTVALERLVIICHFYGLVAIGSCCLLDQTLPMLVRLVIGRAWWTPEISQMLTIYCYYIPFMGFNGILDAFVTSVATPAQMATQSIWMITFTAVYIATAYILLQVLCIGARGLVIANIVNMTLRICWSMVFINNFSSEYNGRLLGIFKQKRNANFAWIEAIPSAAAIVCGGVVAYGLRTALSRVSGVSESLQVLTVSGGLLGVAVLACEVNFITENIVPMLPRRAAKLAATFAGQIKRLLPERISGWTIFGRNEMPKSKVS